MVLAGGESGYLQIWDLINVQEVCRITAHEGTLVTPTDCGLLVHRHNLDNFDKFSELLEYVNIGLARVLFHLYEKKAPNICFSEVLLLCLFSTLISR